jgi:hypothetical protein
LGEREEGKKGKKGGREGGIKKIIGRAGWEGDKGGKTRNKWGGGRLMWCVSEGRERNEKEAERGRKRGQRGIMKS